nr:1-phosphatidylinositol 4,5-bisphosphate phosphodiesterase epsilon-1-like [Pogona vitticeps]
MCAEIQLKMDGSQVELKPLRSQSSNKNKTKSNDCSYIKERKGVSESLSSLHNNFIWNDCLQPVKSCTDCTNDSTDCTCNFMELPTTCGSKTGPQLCAAAVDKYLYLEGATQNLNVACSAHSFSSDNFTGKMPSKPILSHFENCNEGYLEEAEEDFSRSKKERSTLLIRRFCKNDKKVKKSVYTGTRAIVKTLPSGHIGVVAWNCVNHWRRHNELKHHRVISELKFQNSVSQVLSSYLLQSIHHEILKSAKGTGDSLNYFPRPLREPLTQYHGTNCWCKGDNSSIKSCTQQAPEYRATLRRTSLSEFIGGALLEATTSLGSRSGTLNILGGSTGKTMLKDNWLIVAASFQKAVQDTNVTLQTLADLGLKVNVVKSPLQPSQDMDYIDARLNSISARIFLPPERIQELRRAIHPFHPFAKISAHHRQHLLGLMASTTSTLPLTSLKMRSPQAWYLSQFDSISDRPTKRLCVTPELTR